MFGGISGGAAITEGGIARARSREVGHSHSEVAVWLDNKAMGYGNIHYTIWDTTNGSGSGLIETNKLQEDVTTWPGGIATYLREGHGGLRRKVIVSNRWGWDKPP